MPIEGEWAGRVTGGESKRRNRTEKHMEDVATFLLLPVFLVVDFPGLGGVFAAPVVLAVIGWIIARRFPKPMAIAGGCLLAFPLLQWPLWDFIACKSLECNDLGLFILWLGLAVSAYPDPVSLRRAVYYRKGLRIG